MDAAFTCSTGVFHASPRPARACFDLQPQLCALRSSSRSSSHSPPRRTPPHRTPPRRTPPTSANPSATDRRLSDPFASPALRTLAAHPALHPPDRPPRHHTTHTPLTAPASNPAAPQSPSPTQQPYRPRASPADQCIYVYVVIAVDESLSPRVWNHLNTSLFVTQPVTPPPQHSAPPTDAPDSFACFQQVVQLPAHNSRQCREICARILLTDYARHAHRPVLFELFLHVSHQPGPMPSDPHLAWDKLDVVSFIQLPSTGQILRPIGRELLHDHVLCAPPDGLFLGSFFIHDAQLHHHDPSEAALRHQQQHHHLLAPAHDPAAAAAPAPAPERVTLVDPDHIVHETNGARAGRPSHRLTGQLLMTRSQVHKVLEIRARWHGLSPRQRRDNIAARDFYPFFTLNRDETAEYLGVCTTWLKDAIRAHGVNLWPGRPLRRSGAKLQTLKLARQSLRAALQFAHPSAEETQRLADEAAACDAEIDAILNKRISIVGDNMSEEHFQRFLLADGAQYLDPEWNALPPFPISPYGTHT